MKQFIFANFFLSLAIDGKHNIDIKDPDVAKKMEEYKGYVGMGIDFVEIKLTSSLRRGAEIALKDRGLRVFASWTNA